MSADISKDEKERQLDAKIAAIRAKEAAQKQRHREVDKDRKQAEKQNQSITTAPRVKPGEDNYEPQFYHDRGNKHRNIRKSRDDSFTDSNNRKDSKKTAGRLGENDGPPPDPGYRFLADRWRDGSDEDGDESAVEPINFLKETEKSLKSVLRLNMFIFILENFS